MSLSPRIFSTAPSTKEQLEFNYEFTPPNELFSSIRGVKFSSDSGEIHILLQQNGTTPPIISKAEIHQVLDINGGLESAAISHEDPSKPFSYKYYPTSLKGTPFLFRLSQLYIKVKEKAFGPIEKSDLYGDNDWDDIFIGNLWIEIGEIDMSIRDVNGDVVIEFGKVNTSVLTNDSSEDEMIQLARPSIRSDYAQLWENAKELGKLICICRMINRRQECLQELLEDLESIAELDAKSQEKDELGILKSLDKLRFVPPSYPMCNEIEIQKEWANVVSYNNLEGREYRILVGEKERIITSIRNRLGSYDKKRLDFTAEEISSKFDVPYQDVRPLMASYMDKNSGTLAQLVSICSQSRKKKREEEIAKFSSELNKKLKIGLKRRGKAEDKHLDLTFTYGGVTIIPSPEFVPFVESPKEGETFALNIRTNKLLPCTLVDKKDTKIEKETSSFLGHFERPCHHEVVKIEIEPIHKLKVTTDDIQDGIVKHTIACKVGTETAHDDKIEVEKEKVENKKQAIIIVHEEKKKKRGKSRRILKSVGIAIISIFAFFFD